MKRAEFQWLKNWKVSSDRKPVLIRGARQVGKTWLMKEFGRLNYEKVAYVNLEASTALRGVFSGDYDIKRILAALQIETGILIDPGNTLIILDEIQEAQGALTSLKYFQETAPEYHVMGAGSLLGVALAKQGSFPVGKVDFLDLHPFSYPEFLEAIGEGSLVSLLQSNDWQLINEFADKYRDRLRQYYYVGGMPEAVLSFSQQGDLKKVREIQKRILISYEQDFSKHAPATMVPRIRMIWNSIPAQLAKENRKFIYGQLRKGARASQYEEALSWLIDSGLLYKVTNVNKPGLPLKAYEEHAVFKLFLVDIGLLAALTDLDARTLLDGNQVFTEFKGSLTEQYVLQQLKTNKDLPVHYWSPDQSRAELDFIVQHEGQIIPIEVKAEENLSAKSLRVYYEKFKPAFAVRTSMSGYRKEEWMVNWPLYAIHTLLGFSRHLNFPGQ